LEGLLYEKEDLIFEIELELFSIGTITILDETISLLSIRMLEVKIGGEFDPEQGTLD
jgi:hypothetical protein